MEKTQILAALQIENSEIRLVVGQYFHDWFYVIGKECVKCHGTNGVRIVDQHKVILAIKEAVNEASAKLKAPIEKVLLCVPGYRFKIENKVYDHLLSEHIVKEKDIKDIFTAAYKNAMGNDYEIVNVACGYYRINGIVYPKIPLGEKAEMLSSEVDIICGDRLTIYDYVNIVEKAGLKVIDICQDCFGASKEAALFEQSFNTYSVNIHLEASHTVFQLIYNGRVVNGFCEDIGYEQLIKPIMDKFRLSFKDANNILFRYGVIGQEDGIDRIINRWNDHDEVKTITYRDVQQCIYQPANELVETFKKYCSNILERDNVRILISGQGAGLQNLDKVLSEAFGKDVICYCPDLLGVREFKWSALIGTFAAYKDNIATYDAQECCVNMQMYKQNLLPRYEDNDDDRGLTGKLKSLTDKLFVEKQHQEDE